MAFSGSDGPWVASNPTWADVLAATVPGFPGQTFQNILEATKIDETSPIPPALIDEKIGAVYGNTVDTFMRVTWPVIAPFLSGGLPTGDVVGPASATDNAITRFSGTSGKIVQNSLVTVSDTGSISLPASQTVDGRDVSVDGAALDSHIAATGNVHSATFAEILDYDNFTGSNHIVISDAHTLRPPTGLAYQGVKIENFSGDDRSAIRLSTTGTNGGLIRIYVGTRNPEGNILGEPGNIYIRTDGTTSSLYQLRSTTTANTPWVPFGAVGSLAIDDLTDVTITSAAAAEILSYDGADWVNSSIPVSHNFVMSGNASVGSDVGPWFRTGSAFILTEVEVGVKTAPATDLEIDVLDDGVTVFPGSRPTITTGNNTDSVAITPVTVAAGSQITLDIISGGSTWQDLTVSLKGFAVPV